MIKVVFVIVLAGCSAFVLAMLIIGFWNIVDRGVKKKEKLKVNDEVDFLLSMEEEDINSYM